MQLIWARIFLALAICCLPKIAVAEIDCGPLKPNPPRDTNAEVNGKIDAKIQKFFSFGGDIDGTYKEASSDVLKEYPNADKLYIWDRMIYLNCEAIKSLKIPDADKFDRLEKLEDRLGKPPETKSQLETNVIVKYESFNGTASYDVSIKNTGHEEIRSMVVQISAFTNLLDPEGHKLPTRGPETFCARQNVNTEYPGCIKGRNSESAYLLKSAYESRLLKGGATAEIGALLYASLYAVPFEFKDECRDIPPNATIRFFVYVEGFEKTPSGGCPENSELVGGGTDGIAMVPEEFTLDVIAPNGKINQRIGPTSEPIRWTKSGTRYLFSSSRSTT